MQRSTKQKVFLVAAVAALLAAGALAAVSATGQGNHRRAYAVRRAARDHHARDLASVSSYLGIPSAQLTSGLSSGKTLAQIAQATPGKSAAGLIGALVAAKKARIDALAAGLPRRVSAEVNRPGGPAGRAPQGGRHARGGARRVAVLFAGPMRPGSVAAGYLGVSPSQLQSELLAGRTLGQIAAATAGKSQDGLRAALVDSARQRLARALSAGRLTAAREGERMGRLEKHAEHLLARKFAGSTSH